MRFNVFSGFLRSNIQRRFLYTLRERGISPDLSQAEQDKLLNRSRPFPYKTKKFNRLWGMVDRPLERWDENSKIFIVEGNCASGRSTFAKNLAKELGMKYFSAANLDMYYINDYGFDIRWLNAFLPIDGPFLPGETAPDYRDIMNLDESHFYREPTDQASNAKMRLKLMHVKTQQYIDALNHLFHTGQGCVIENSVFCDMIELQAMFKRGYLSEGARNHFFRLRSVLSKPGLEVNYPHLAIYLDVPPQKCLERIQNTKDERSQSSVFQDTLFLEAIDEAFKTFFFRDMEDFSEVIAYDWSEFGDVSWVCDDLKKMNLDFSMSNVERMKDWYFHSHNAYNDKRIKLADRQYFDSMFQQFVFICDDFNRNPNHLIVHHRLMNMEVDLCGAYSNKTFKKGKNLFSHASLRFVNDTMAERYALRDKLSEYMANSEFIKKVERRADFLNKNRDFRPQLEHW